MASTQPNQNQAPQQGAQGQQNQQESRSLQAVRRSPIGSMFASPFFSFGPFAMMRRLFDDLEQLVGLGPFDTGEQLDRASSASRSMFVPQVDVSHRDDKLVVHVDLPGLSPDDVRLQIDSGALIIEGERKNERELDAGGILRTERYYGRFQRVVPLPDGADPDSAEARFENGVLEISIKAPQRQNRRQIEIRTSSDPSVAKDTARH